MIEKTPLFNLDMYLYQLTSDLDQHAQYLHSRDVHNMVKFMHAHREFQFLKTRITLIQNYEFYKHLKFGFGLRVTLP